MTPPTGAHKSRVSSSAATTLAVFVSLVIAIVVAIAVGVAVVALWYADTMGEGVAAFIVTFIAVGLFSNLVGLAALISRHHVPSPYTLFFALTPWLFLGIRETWTTCRAYFITWDNWRWILKSADLRLYELNWIFTGWLAIGISALLGLITSRMLIAKAKAKRLAATATT
ncbi:MAG: hypothetical protein WA188_18160 [Terriglobales bacterium]